HPKPLRRRAEDWGLAPSHMSRADFDAFIHEIGEFWELLLDVAYGPTTIDHEHRPRLPHFGDGDGGGGMAEALAPGDDEERPEAVDRPGAFGEGVFDAESVEDVGGVWVREVDFPVVVAGQEVEALAGGLQEGDADGHRRAPFQETMQLCYRREEGRGPFGPRQWRQPAKAPIWAVAAFFSTWASAGAS